MEKNLKTVYIDIKLNHFAVHLNHCKLTILQFKKESIYDCDISRKNTAALTAEQ